MRRQGYNFRHEEGCARIDRFVEALPEGDKRDVLAQLLERLISSPYSSPSGQELNHVADLVFQEYDATLGC